MYNKQFETFIASILAQDTSSSYFWNLVSLAKNDLARFHGPKTEDEFFNKVKTEKNYSQTQQNQDKILQDLYINIDSPYVKYSLSWVLYLSPFVVQSDCLPFVLEGTPYYESDCYNAILCDIKKITNPKLEYDILSKIINKYRGKQNIPQDILVSYEVATFYRSCCKYALLPNPAVQEARIQDLRVFMNYTNPAESKLYGAERIAKILSNKLENTVKTADDEHLDSQVKEICDLANECAVKAGPSNQKFIDRVGQVFNYNTLMVEIPMFVRKKLDLRNK